MTPPTPSARTQPSMRELVSLLVRSECGERPGASAVFLKVFQRLSAAPAPPLRSRDETIIAEELAERLLQLGGLGTLRETGTAEEMGQVKGKGPGTGTGGAGPGLGGSEAAPGLATAGVDCRVRFQSLRRRLQQLPAQLLRPEVRCAALRCLSLLSGFGQAQAQAPALSQGPGGRECHDHTLALATEMGAGRKRTSNVVKGPDWRGGPVAPSASAAPVAPALQLHLDLDLGWHLAGASARPSAIGEPEVVRELLHALQGVDSSCFCFSEAEGQFLVSPSFVFSRPARAVVQRVLELASLHMRLRRATGAAREGLSGRSLLHQALCEAIYEQLRDYSKLLVLLVSKSELSELTIRRLWTWLLAPQCRICLLVTLCDACEPLRGGALASAVHGFSQVGDSSARSACTAVLERVVRPLLSMIRAWMTDGELHDPYGEFFVCADSSVPLEDLWTSMYHLEVEMVPRFVTLELAHKILLTGKSVNFIRLCCPGNGQGESRPEMEAHFPRPSAASGPRPVSEAAATAVLPAATGVGSPATAGSAVALAAGVGAGALAGRGGGGGGGGDWVLQDLGFRVEQAARQTNRQLVSLLMERFKLMEHCQALRRFLLLGQGDFVECLMDTAAAELSRSASAVQRHQLMGVLDMAVRQSNAQFCSPDIVARLGVKLLSPSSGERGWDIFLLDYAIDSPLHVVFTASAMQQYDRAFAFLWKLRRVSHALAGCWSRHMALQRQLVSCEQQMAGQAPELGLEMRQTLHRCTCLRNEMQHFVQSVYSHIMCEVLETSWAGLQAGWQASADLDELIQEHQHYLAHIEEGAFLAPRAEAIFTQLSALFGLALEFTELHEQVCHSASEALELLLQELREPAGLGPFARSLAECRAQLDQIGAALLVRLQALLRALETQPALRLLSSDLRFLLCRLDFNGYYESRRLAPAERSWQG